MADYLQQSGREMLLCLFCLFMLNPGFHSEVNAQHLASSLPLHNRGWQAEKVSLKQLLGELENLYDVKFAFDERLVQDKFVNPEEIEKKDLDEILSKVLQPLKLQFKQLTEKHYVIKKSTEENKKGVLKIRNRGVDVAPSVPRRISPQKLFQLQRSVQMLEKTITGTVTDGESGETLPGVNILAKGTTTGTVTNAEGFYRLTVSDNVNTLVFSSIGYLTQEIQIGNQTEINVTLEPDVKSLEEIVVVGYGTQKKSDLTGAVASVSGEELTSQPITSIEQGLQGRMAGVAITQNSSAPGGGISVKIRGTTSILNGSEPLYVIDGFPVTGQSQFTTDAGRGLDSSTGSNYTVNQNPLAALNPSDIQSIEVLKDASAAAIYGVRGANGVVLITTKRGEQGAPHITTV